MWADNRELSIKTAAITWFVITLLITTFPFVFVASHYVRARGQVFWGTWLATAATWSTIVSHTLHERHLDRLEWVAFGVVAASVSCLVAIDVAVKRLPLTISYGSFVIALTLLAISWRSEWSGIWGALVGAASMFAIALLLSRFRTGIGRGDVHLAPLLGLTVGWFDPWSVLVAWFFALLSGGVVSAILLGSRRFSRKSTVPYGPFLVLGTAAAVALVS